MSSQSQTEREFDEFDNNKVWTEVYQRLKNEASLLTLGDDFSTKISREPHNRWKNRYRDVSPCIYEVQYLSCGCGQESYEECQSKWEACTKNPGHKDFIPVGKFTMEHLPESIRRNDVYSYITCMCDVTVRVQVKYRCKERLKYWPLLGAGDKATVGTGYVWRIEEIKPSQRNCPCFSHDTMPGKNCNLYQNKLWMIELYTAAHVFYNDEEAKYASVEFFYNDKESRSGGRLVSLDVKHVNRVNAEFEGDLCEFHCLTDNEELVNKLNDSLKIVNQPNTDPDMHTHERVIIVSHPHGQPKHISIGERATPPEQETPLDARAYYTATCPGSSGAPVFYRERDLWFKLRAHSATRNGVNVCSDSILPIDKHLKSTQWRCGFS